MAGLKESIQTMIDNIDVYCDLLLAERRAQAESIRPEMSENFKLLIGAMIGLYDQPRFESVKEDKQYWISQLSRIGEALSSPDVFFTVDVLRNETAENFKLFCHML